jgi:hypothetical protein
MFVSKQEAINVIQSASYFTQMSPLDLEARASSSKEDYTARYVESLRDFTTDEQILLEEDIQYANLLTEKYPHLNGIQWKLAKLCCNIEKGFPHTLGNIIFVGEEFFAKQSQFQQVQTLIHEKIHIYQRLYPLETNLLITKYWDYTIHDILKKYPDSRNNPDLNNIMYANKDGVYFYQSFHSNPKSLADAKIKFNLENHSNVDRDPTEIYEHPFEKMSYVLANIIVQEKATTEDERKAVSWVQKYL